MVGEGFQHLAAISSHTTIKPDGDVASSAMFFVPPGMQIKNVFIDVNEVKLADGYATWHFRIEYEPKPIEATQPTTAQPVQ